MLSFKTRLNETRTHRVLFYNYAKGKKLGKQVGPIFSPQPRPVLSVIAQKTVYLQISCPTLKNEKSMVHASPVCVDFCIRMVLEHGFQE